MDKNMTGPTVETNTTHLLEIKQLDVLAFATATKGDFTLADFFTCEFGYLPESKWVP